MTPDDNAISTELRLSYAAAMQLKETAKWARFLGFVGFICCIVLLLSAFFGHYIMTVLVVFVSVMAIKTGAAFGIFYIIAASLFFLISLYLYLFGTKMEVALQINEQQLFDDSLQKLKNGYRMQGILIIIVLCFFFLGVVGGMLVGLN